MGHLTVEGADRTGAVQQIARADRRHITARGGGGRRERETEFGEFGFGIHLKKITVTDRIAKLLLGDSRQEFRRRDTIRRRRFAQNFQLRQFINLLADAL